MKGNANSDSIKANLSSSLLSATVQFPEYTTVFKEQFDNNLFDIIQNDAPNNDFYCQELIDKIFSLPYAQLPDFFTHHCNIALDPLKWLNKFEKLIAENESLFSNFTNQGRMMKCLAI